MKPPFLADEGLLSIILAGCGQLVKMHGIFNDLYIILLICGEKEKEKKKI